MWVAAVLLAASFTVNDASYSHPRQITIYRSAQPAKNLFVFIESELYQTEIGLPATLDALKIPATVVTIEITERAGEITNRKKFADFVANDLMPALKEKLGALPDARHTAIGGYSFGGLTAAYVAVQHPEIFGNVLSQSGAFWRGNEGASDPPEWLTQQLREKPKLPIRFYIEVGAEEHQVVPNRMEFIVANRHLRDVLAAKKYDFKYVEVPGAKHEPGHWKAALPAGIAWLAQ